VELPGNGPWLAGIAVLALAAAEKAETVLHGPAAWHPVERRGRTEPTTPSPRRHQACSSRGPRMLTGGNPW